MGMPIYPLRGVNLRDDPRRIRDDECLRAKNLAPYSPGIIRKRKGSILKDAPNSFTGSAICIGAVIPPFKSSTLLTFWHEYNEGTGEYYWEGILDYSGGTVTLNNAPRGDCKYTPACVLDQNKIYVFPGAPHTSSGYVYEEVAGVPTASAFTFGGTGNSNLIPAVATIYRGRFVYGNLGSGYEDYIVFADPGAPTLVGNSILSANSRALRIGDTTGDRIVAMLEITQSNVESSSTSQLLILKERSAYLISGEPNYTTDPTPIAPDTIFGDMIVSRLNVNCGCASPQSVARTPDGIFWAGIDDVWYLAVGALPVPVGTKIRKALLETPPEYKWRWTGVYHDGFYRLAIFAPGQGPNRISPLSDQWWLDLHYGPPRNADEASWWGPQAYVFGNAEAAFSAGPPYGNRYGVDTMYINTREDTSTQLEAITTYPSDVNTGYQPTYMYVATLDIDSPRDAFISDSNIINGANIIYADNMGTEITYELITKELDFEAAYYDKLLRGVKVDFWTDIAQYMECELTKDGSTYATSGTGNGLRLLMEQAGMSTSVDLLATATPGDGTNQLGRVPQKGFMIDVDENHVAQTFRLKFYDVAGYVVADGLDVLVLRYNGTDYAIDIPNGYYADLDALLDAIRTAIMAAIPALTVTDNFATARSYALPAANILTFSASVSLRFQSAGASITAAQLRKCRALMGMLGWNTSADTASSVTQSASVVVYLKRTGSIEINGLEADITIFEREVT